MFTLRSCAQSFPLSAPLFLPCAPEEWFVQILPSGFQLDLASGRNLWKSGWWKERQQGTSLVPYPFCIGFWKALINTREHLGPIHYFRSRVAMASQLGSPWLLLSLFLVLKLLNSLRIKIFSVKHFWGTHLLTGPWLIESREKGRQLWKRCWVRVWPGLHVNLKVFESKADTEVILIYWRATLMTFCIQRAGRDHLCTFRVAYIYANMVNIIP